MQRGEGTARTLRHGEGRARHRVSLRSTSDHQGTLASVLLRDLRERQQVARRRQLRCRSVTPVGLRRFNLPETRRACLLTGRRRAHCSGYMCMHVSPVASTCTRIIRAKIAECVHRRSHAGGPGIRPSCGVISDLAVPAVCYCDLASLYTSSYR
jgi:hypothetical protein